jgi:hypothetical protein
MSTRGRVVGLSAAAVLAAAAAAGLYVSRDVGEATEGAASSSASASAVEAEASASAQAGGAAATASPTEVPNPRSGQTIATDEPVVVSGTVVPVVVTFSGWNAVSEEVQVGGYVPGVVEDGGTCTLTLTQGDRSVAAEADATADAATTACGAVTVRGTELSDGTWSAVLSYESADRAGAADAVDIEVQR